jgi:hypothetical protein
MRFERINPDASVMDISKLSLQETHLVLQYNIFVDRSYNILGKSNQLVLFVSRFVLTLHPHRISFAFTSS